MRQGSAGRGSKGARKRQSERAGESWGVGYGSSHTHSGSLGACIYERVV